MIPATAPTLVKRLDALKRLGVCRQTLRNWEVKGWLPRIEFGKRVRYREEDVRRIEENGIPPKGDGAL